MTVDDEDLELREVEKEKCVCENGYPAERGECITGTECFSCNDGYHLVDDSCHLLCNDGYHLVDESCHKDTMMYKIKEYLMNILGYVGPLLILFVLYYFRKYYKTHNNIYMFVSIFVVIYILLYYILFFDLPKKIILGTGTDNVEP